LTRAKKTPEGFPPDPKWAEHSEAVDDVRKDLTNLETSLKSLEKDKDPLSTST
jgi:hypothetical protein